jgi:single-stranded-DNA-specific exonuclease
MPKHWRIVSHDADAVQRLQRATGLPALVAHLLVSRDIDADQATGFLNPKLTDLRPPEQLPGVEDAIRRVAAAAADGRRIVIYGDYDADGITGTAILFRCLRLLSADVHYYIPNRLDEGYGLNNDAVQKLAGEGTSLLVTVDCGIASLEQARLAKQLGLELIITDHHAMADALPEADAIVHPALPGHDYPFAGLCGAGVAFKLAWAICQHVCRAKRVSPQLRQFLLQAVGLAAIGTVADVVPLLDENRVLVHHGLMSLRHHPVLGGEQLARQAGLHDKPEWASEDIAFTLAPRINAAGRLGQATLAVELLTTENQQRASSLVEYICELNKSRDSLERSVYRAANQQAVAAMDAGEDAALVLAGHGWHPGVIGIVAGRLAEKYHRPVLLVALDQSGVKPGQGSARSVPGLNLVDGLASCQAQLVSYGGHAAAAGFKVHEARIEAFRDEFCQFASENTDGNARVAELRIEAEVPFSILTLDAVQQVERLAPFGQANPRPVLCTSSIELATPPRAIGSGGRHLAMELAQHGIRLRGVAFGRGEWSEKLSEEQGPLALAYRPVINTFRGRRSVELHIDDWRAEQPATTTNSPLASTS